MRSFDEYLKESLEDKEFAKTYDEVKADIDLAIALTRQREALGLTQQQVADMTGIKQPMLARIERGQMPKAATLQKLAKALNVGVYFTGENVVVVKVETVALGGVIQWALDNLLNKNEAEIPLGKVVDINDYKKKKKREPLKVKVENYEEEYESVKSVVG